MNEADFQQQVIDLCKLLRLKWYHSYDSRRSVPGYPDLTIVGNDGVVFAELKSKRGVVTPDQRDWINALLRAGQEVYVWRPGDMDKINDVLHRIAGRRLPSER